MHWAVLLWVAGGVVAVGLATIGFFFRGSSPSDDLGAVSDLWIASHRSNPD
jgi:hypothetical protein